MQSLKILVVEDEELVALNLANRLNAKGYQVMETVPSGEQAIELAEKKLPDLILMDVSLAGKLDGIETSRRIFNRFHIPIIYLTAFSC